MVKVDMEGIKRLSIPERVQLVEEIWDTLPASVEQLPLTKEQKAVVDRRLGEHRRDPTSAIPWYEVRARLESE